MSHWPTVLPELAHATGTTLSTACLATVLTVVLGLPLGVLLVATDKDGPLPIRTLHVVLAGLVEILGSIPVVVFLLAAIPLVRGITGDSAGTVVVPLALAATPWFARRVETSLRAVDPELVEIAVAMGARVRHVLVTVLLREGLPRIVSGVALTTVLLLGSAAILDVLDRRGLGGMALAYGMEDLRADVVVVVAGVFVVVVQVVKWLGGLAAQRLDHRR